MKKHLICFAICLFNLHAHSQWQLQNSGTTNLLKDLYFLSAMQGYAVGDNGTLLKTTDGGINWNSQVSPTTSNLNSIKFIDANTGYIAVQDTFFLKTVDGGNTWTIEQLDTIKENPGSCFFCMYNLVDFFDASNGLIVLSEGQLTKAQTSDGGLKWDMKTEGLSASMNTAMSWPVKDSMYILDINRKLAKSTNGGVNWSEMTLATGNVFYFDTYFINGKTGFVTGERSGTLKSFISKTNDGGASWTFVLQDSLLNKRILNMDFDNAGHGIAVGKGVILSTLNYGDTWGVDSLTFPLPGQLYGARITSAGVFAVGINGTILKWINSPLGISGATKEQRLVKLYPNPSKEKTVSISTGNTTDKCELKLFSTLGQLVYKREFFSNELLSIDLSKGFYTYVITSDERFYTGKLILE